MPVKGKKKDRDSYLSNAFSSFLANTPDIVYVKGADMTYLGVSHSFAGCLGFSDPDALLGKTVFEAIPDREIAQKYYEDDKHVLETGESLLGLEERIPDPNGNVRFGSTSKFAILDAHGVPNAVLSISRDITREREAQADHEQEIQYLLHMQDSKGEMSGAWLIDVSEWRVKEFRNIGETRFHKDLCGKDIEQYRQSAIESAGDDLGARAFFELFTQDSLTDMYKAGKRRVEHEYERTMPDGVRRWIHVVTRLLTDPTTGHLVAVLILFDVDAEKRTQRDLIKAGEVDLMTGLLNHDTVLKHIDKYLAGDGSDGSHALFMVDRDNLKNINDTLGHQVGDDVIVQTAKAIKAVFRDTDIIGRVGGDEFLILMKNIGSVRTVRTKASELLQSLQCICGSGGQTLESTGSIGISFFSAGDKNIERLYAEADTAMYRAKTGGRNIYAMYSYELNGSADEIYTRESLMETVNLRALLNSIDGGVLVAHANQGKDPAPVFFSDSFLTMMGGLTQKEAFEIYGESLFECIHPDDEPRVVAEYNAALKSGGPLRTTYRLRGKDGFYCWLSVGMNMTHNSDGSVDAYGVHTNIEKLMCHEERLASNEQRYRMAFAQTSHLMCEVDIAKNAVTFFDNDGEILVPETVANDMPESIISSGYIHLDSAEAFRQFYEEMRQGRKEDKGLFKCRYSDMGNYNWMSFSYQTLFDKNGKPEKAIGSLEVLPNISGEQTQFVREELLLDSVKKDLLATMKVNLTRDSIEKIHIDEDCKLAEEKITSYTDLIEKLISSASYSDDAMLLQLELQLSSIVSSYREGRKWVSVEYRRKEVDTRWTEITVYMIEAPASHHLYAFIYISDVQKRRSAEEIVPIAVERDPVSHLYTQETAEKLIDSLMRNSSASDKLFSLAIIHLTGLPSLRAKVGTVNAGVEVMYFGRYISILLDKDCIIGRYGDDSFFVFCPDSLSNEWMREKINDAVARVRQDTKSVEAENQLKIVCGIATERARRAGLAGMRSQALQICSSYRNTETDVVSSFEQYVDAFRISGKDLDDNSFVAVDVEELNRPLFGSEKELMSECMSAMLSADNYDVSANKVLAVLGRYYDAQRVYTLALLDDNSTATMQNEWVAEGKVSTLRNVSGVSLKKLPILKRALILAKPIILGDTKSVLENAHRGNNGWHFILIPIILECKVHGFLCIENPKKCMTDVALPNALIPMLMHERSRFGVDSGGMKITGRDELTGLPDPSSYNSALQIFNPDAYHSVGGIYVSVTALHNMTRTKGIEYGNEMIVFAAQTLSDVCRKASIYRTSGQEFAVISVNMSEEAFLAQSSRIRSIMQRRYPKGFVFGEAWSDEGISVRKLLKEAETQAHSGVKKPPYAHEARAEADNVSEEFHTALSSGRFLVYLQPQVDMRTGKVTGAEALSRLRGSNGGIILPSEFIDRLEKAELIRELDYHVLDQVFAALQEWISHGGKPVPISVNFSRQTLMSHTVLASSLAIRSRYDVPEDLVEIEVTESIGNSDPGTMYRTVEGLRQQGFRFALDDLGSEYSSLQTLRNVDFDTVKLDMSLINSFMYNSMSSSIVESVINACAKNNLKCVAEGVKSEEIVSALLKSGCIYGQGYFYGKPMPISGFYTKYIEDK